MTDNKMDYARFLRNPPSPGPGHAPRNSEPQTHGKLDLLEEDIPWAEIIDERGDVLDIPLDSDFASRISLFSAGSPMGSAPPIAVLVVVALVIFYFLFH
jgi:hypothetical protein